MIGQVDEEILSQLPQPDSLKRLIRRQRPSPPDPSEPQDFDIFTPECQSLVDGSLFLQYDSGPQPHRIAIFAEDRMIRLLAEAEVILMCCIDIFGRYYLFIIFQMMWKRFKQINK